MEGGCILDEMDGGEGNRNYLEGLDPPQNFRILTSLSVREERAIMARE